MSNSLALTAGARDSAVLSQQADALANIGVIRRKQGRLRESRRSLKEAVRTAELDGPTDGECLAYALDNLGLTLQRMSLLDEALDCFQRTLSLRLEVGDKLGEAQSQLNIARCSAVLGRSNAAPLAAERAVELFRSFGTKAQLANALVAAGESYVASGTAHDAESVFLEAHELNFAAGNSDGISVASAQLSRLNLACGDVAAATRYAEEVRDLASASVNREGYAVSLGLLAQIDVASDRLEQAAESLHEARKIWRIAGDPAHEITTLLDLAGVQMKRGDDSAARSALCDAEMRSAQLNAASPLLQRLSEAMSAVNLDSSQAESA